MSKVKKRRTNLDYNLMGEDFITTPSGTLFSFDNFEPTIDDSVRRIRVPRDLTKYAKTITLDTLGITQGESDEIGKKTNSVVLNLDNRDLRTFVRFGSSYEYLRMCIENIIKKYPYSFYCKRDDAPTALNIQHENDKTKFYILETYVDENSNKFVLENNYLKYLGTDTHVPTSDFVLIVENKSYKIIEIKQHNKGYFVTVDGLVFEGYSEYSQNYHIKPNDYQIGKLWNKFNDYEKYLLSNRLEDGSYNVNIKDPTPIENGDVVFVNRNITWNSEDGYNIDIDSPAYARFLETILTIGAKYDATKTDLIARFLTPQSLKLYDTTNNSKMSKLLRLYGREFDEIRKFIDSLLYINTITYDKLNNIPDILIKNLANTLGWDYFDLLSDDDIIGTLLKVGDDRLVNTPPEINIELWRRIIQNTNYLWKSKGTRDSIKAILLMVGIPEEFVNITEYVYTVSGKIDPNNAILEDISFPNNSKPYDMDGYPKAPKESDSFYFQISGNRDSGEEYMDVFRKAGFNLTLTPDNKKSWIYDGNVVRKGDDTPEYTQIDSRLVLNTKAVDISLDVSQALENDIFDFIKDELQRTDPRYAKSIQYINIGLGVGQTASEFNLPSNYNVNTDDIEVRFNGILLLNGKDYEIENNKLTLPNGITATRFGNKRDTLQVTYITRAVENKIEVKYVVAEAIIETDKTYFELGDYSPSGDIQLTLNGIALTKEKDFFYNTEENRIYILENEIILYLEKEPIIQIAFIDVLDAETNEENLKIYNEYFVVSSSSTNKLTKSLNNYVYTLDYKITHTTDIKVLINGIMLEPGVDYVLNDENPYEIYLPKSIKYGHVIHVYYFVSDEVKQKSPIDDILGMDDLDELSFLEFVERVRTTLVNTRNRKTISNFRGGWYPNLEKLFEIYYTRSVGGNGGGETSNGYTYDTLQKFLSKYNGIFENFVNRLLPSTIIIRGGTGGEEDYDDNGGYYEDDYGDGGGGIGGGSFLIRNSVFNVQKFMYRRGVTLLDKLPDTTNEDYANYLGDDGCMFKVLQPTVDFEIETIEGTVDTYEIKNVGGFVTENIGLVVKYGIEYRTMDINNEWSIIGGGTTLGSDGKFYLNIENLQPETKYEYRAFIRTNENRKVNGNSIQVTTNRIPIPLTVETVENAIIVDQEFNPGGIISGDFGMDETIVEYGIEISEVGVAIEPKVETGSISPKIYLIPNEIRNNKIKYLYNGDDVTEFGIEYKLIFGYYSVTPNHDFHVVGQTYTHNGIEKCRDVSSRIATGINLNNRYDDVWTFKVEFVNNTNPPSFMGCNYDDKVVGIEYEAYIIFNENKITSPRKETMFTYISDDGFALG